MSGKNCDDSVVIRLQATPPMQFRRPRRLAAISRLACRLQDWRLVRAVNATAAPAGGGGGTSVLPIAAIKFGDSLAREGADQLRIPSRLPERAEPLATVTRSILFLA